jgi:tRNA nucleotidyltransferase (CCA-adding enzyme)
VGVPDERINEDALRIMRALRFSSVLGFSIDSDTADAVHRNKNLLLNISPERIREELCKMIGGENIRNVLMKFSDIMAEIIPEFARCIGFEQNNPYHIFDVYEHIAAAVEYYTGGDIIIKLALLFHDIGKPSCYSENERGGHFYGHEKPGADMTDVIMKRLRFDNDTRNRTVELVLFHDAETFPSYKSVRRWLYKLGTVQFLRLLEVKGADIKAHSDKGLSEKLDNLEKIKEIYTDITKKLQCFSLRDLAVNGEDLKKSGIPEGKRIGEALDMLLNKVIDGELENKKETLLKGIELYKNI